MHCTVRRIDEHETFHEDLSELVHGVGPYIMFVRG